jgi:uncharacterized protein DUF4012
MADDKKPEEEKAKDQENPKEESEDKKDDADKKEGKSEDSKDEKVDEKKKEGSEGGEEKAEEKSDEGKKKDDDKEGKEGDEKGETEEQDKKEENGDKKPKEEKKEEHKDEHKKEAPKDKSQKTPYEKKIATLIKKNTDPKTDELVKEIKSVAKSLDQMHKENEMELEQLGIKDQVEEEVQAEEASSKASDDNSDDDQADDKKSDDNSDDEEKEDKDGEEEKSKDEDKKDDKDKKDEKKEESKEKEEEEEAEEKAPEPKPEKEQKKDEKPKSEKELQKEIMESSLGKNKDTKTVKEAKPNFFKKLFKNKILSIVIIILLVLFGLVLGAAIVLYLNVNPFIDSAKQTALLGKETAEAIKTQNLPLAAEKLKSTKESFIQTQEKFDKLSFVKFFPVAKKYHQDTEAVFVAGLAGLEAGEILLNTITPYADLLGFSGEGSFTGGTAEDRIVKIVETLDKITPSLEQIAEKINIIQTQFEEIDPNDYPEMYKDFVIRENIVNAKLALTDANTAFTGARPLIETLPQVLGHPTPQKYLVIFQNDGELRPTGGFMSAFAVLQVDKGKIVYEKSDDIYALDKKFTNKPESPAVLDKYLNEQSWNLRNMNMSPDFKVSMQTFDKYYSQLPGEASVSGIIAIDTYTLLKVVEILGPIEIPGYGTFTTEMDDRCNLPNIVCELEHIVDKPLATLVSNRKAGILGPMMKTIMEKALQGENDQLSKLVPLGFELFKQKHVLAYFKNEKAQAGAEAFNIAGTIQAYEGDYIHVNDANLGGAKSNFYITQEVEQDIEIKEDGTIQKTVSISYTHSEPMDNCNLEAGELCLSGIQRNYFRVYVPAGSTLIEGIGSETEITASEDLGKTFFEGKFDLRPESTAKIILTYALPFKVESGQSYKMLIQKQPGTQTVKHIVKLNGTEEKFEVNEDVEKEWTL